MESLTTEPLGKPLVVLYYATVKKKKTNHIYMNLGNSNPLFKEQLSFFLSVFSLTARRKGIIDFKKILVLILP